MSDPVQASLIGPQLGRCDSAESPMHDSLATGGHGGNPEFPPAECRERLPYCVCTREAIPPQTAAYTHALE